MGKKNKKLDKKRRMLSKILKAKFKNEKSKSEELKDQEIVDNEKIDYDEEIIENAVFDEAKERRREEFLARVKCSPDTVKKAESYYAGSKAQYNERKKQEKLLETIFKMEKAKQEEGKEER